MRRLNGLKQQVMQLAPELPAIAGDVKIGKFSTPAFSVRLQSPSDSGCILHPQKLTDQEQVTLKGIMAWENISIESQIKCKPVNQ